MFHLSDTGSASDLARLECELWQTQNGIWNPDVLRCFRHVFCASGILVQLSHTASATDLARGSPEPAGGAGGGQRGVLDRGTACRHLWCIGLL